MNKLEISVVCPVGEDTGDLRLVHEEARQALIRSGRTAEFLYVLDGDWSVPEKVLQSIREDRFDFKVLRMAKGFGESAALQVGFARARGRYIVTLPSWQEIDAAVIHDVLAELDRGHEVVVTRREPRSDALFNRIQSRVFHGLVHRFVGQRFRDLTCGLRGLTREAALKLDLYGDQHRFIPVIATRLGFTVIEIPGNQHPQNKKMRLYNPGVYVRRLLDILNIYFLTRFTRKPLRFFGLIGCFVGGVGFLITSYLGIERLLGRTALADRPLLLLGVLLLVLGVQVISIGLLGEIIIFLSSKREIPEVAELLGSGEPAPVQDLARAPREQRVPIS